VLRLETINMTALPTSWPPWTRPTSACPRVATSSAIQHSPDGPAWRIGIEDPHDPKRLIAMVPVHSGSVATSGTASRGDHLVDPRTGQRPTGIASVTVIAESLTWAEIDTTASYIHGRDAARWL
jgi:thiamine biosynthesis lipoprotein ApbE